jgi:GAF domain-containing protein
VSLSFYSPAPRPADERSRQNAVDASGVIWAPPDAALHSVVATAAMRFGTAMAAVSIIDRDRQWFAARVGIGLPETSRAISFCAHAILNPGEPLVIEDAEKDERFAGNPLVIGDPHIAFYAGMPIVDDEGYALGALCILDRAPRSFNAGDREMLADLSRRAGRAIADLAESRS